MFVRSVAFFVALALAAMPLLSHALSDSVNSVRVTAAYALAALGPAALPASSRLLSALRDTSAAIRTAAIFALGQLGLSGRAVAESAIVARMSDANPTAAATASDALHALRGEAIRYRRLPEPTPEDKCRNRPRGTFGC